MYPHADVSVVVEILERVPPEKNCDAIKFHYDSLANDNEAGSAQILGLTELPNASGDGVLFTITLHGTQEIKKFNRQTPDQVRILMALYRLEKTPIDLVVTFNIPLRSADGGAVTNEQDNKAVEDFDVLVRSLRILDFGLFA